MKTECNIGEIFREYGQEFERSYPLFSEQRKALRAIAVCRTEHLGGHVDRCQSCGHEKPSYNSCRNHNCPTCQGIARRKWIQARMQEVLPVPYYHVVFTLPQEINSLLSHNQKEIYSLLFQASSATMLHFFKKTYGGTPGILATLHTWGQTLCLHPHVHMLVTGGCLSASTEKWISAGSSFLFDVHRLSEEFRNRFLKGLKQLAAGKKLFFRSEESRNCFEPMIAALQDKAWVVHCKRPFGGAEVVVEYLGRYVFRSAIANSRIKQVAGGRVLFDYKDYRDCDERGAARHKLMNLSAMEFIRRFLQHVLPKQFCRIRCYGILGGRGRKQNLETCKKLLSCPKIVEKTVAETEAVPEYNICPVCGGEMIKHGIIAGSCLPKPILFRTEQTLAA